jgi:putative ATP-dependent endonuclease of OLD family
VKLLCALCIPFAVITDFDMIDGRPRSYKRCLKLTRTIDTARGGADTDGLIAAIKAIDNYDETYEKFEDFGLFVNDSTLETEMFGGDYAEAMIATLREHNFSAERLALLDAWETKPSDVDAKILIKMIEQMGKGRFAQRLVSRIKGLTVPHYIANAINHVIGLV